MTTFISSKAHKIIEWTNRQSGLTCRWLIVITKKNKKMPNLKKITKPLTNKVYVFKALPTDRQNNVQARCAEGI